MQINVTRDGWQAVARIEGDLRLAGVADAKPALVAALAAGGDVQLDLSALGDCDTAGVQLLLMAGASARAKGKRLRHDRRIPPHFGPRSTGSASRPRVSNSRPLARGNGQDDPGRPVIRPP